MQRTGWGGGGGGGCLNLRRIDGQDHRRHNFRAWVDPGFELGGAPNVHVSTQTVPHSLSSPRPGLETMEITWNRDTIITININ